MQLAGHLGISVPQSLAWVPYLIGGIIGAVLILILLDWALIILSSFAGASLIVDSAALRQFNMSIIFVALVIIGILVQAGVLLRSRRASV